MSISRNHKQLNLDRPQILALQALYNASVQHPSLIAVRALHWFLVLYAASSIQRSSASVHCAAQSPRMRGPAASIRHQSVGAHGTPQESPFHAPDTSFQPQVSDSFITVSSTLSNITNQIPNQRTLSCLLRSFCVHICMHACMHIHACGRAYRHACACMLFSYGVTDIRNCGRAYIGMHVHACFFHMV